MALNDYCVATGLTSPLTEGTYTEREAFEGHKAFYCIDIDYYIYWLASYESWFMSDVLGSDKEASFQFYEPTGLDPTGTYAPTSEEVEGETSVVYTEVPDDICIFLIHNEGY